MSARGCRPGESLAQAEDRGLWLDADGETAFLCASGDRVQWVRNTVTGRGAYYDCGTDLMIEESMLRSYGLE